MVTTIEEEIKKYDEAIKMGDFPSPSNECRKCNASVEKFSLHEQKKRIFLLIVGEWVKKIVTILLRYKCPRCKATFMHYPAFAMPYKRYTKENILELSEKYISQQDQSYEDCSSSGRTVIEYGIPEEDGHSQCFDKSTLHRWITSLGDLSKSLAQALKLIGEKAGGSSIFRDLAEMDIFPNKYRSEKRREVLKICKKLVMANREFESIFLISIFPQFATKKWKGSS